MSIVTADPMDIMLTIMDICCEKHEHCNGCKNLQSCRRLWDRLSEQVYSKPLSPEQLNSYIEAFYQLWITDDNENFFMQN
jgi:hypothetical protein